MIWIKNIDTIAHTWAGQLINAGSYHNVLTSIEKKGFANNEQFLKDYSAGKCLIANDDSGNNDVSDFIEGLDLLRHENVIQQTEDVIVQSTYDTRHIGVVSSATKTTTTDIDLAIPADINHLQGGKFVFKEHVWGDKYDVQTIDIDNVFGYGAGFVLSTNFKNIPVDPTGVHDFKSQFMSKEVPAGLYCRLKYTSIGTQNDVDVLWTLYGRKKPS